MWPTAGCVYFRSAYSSAASTLRINFIEVSERPAPPLPVKVTSPNNTSMAVSWDAPGNKGKPDITGYELRHRLAAWTSTSFAAEVISTNVTEMSGRTLYDIQVATFTAR